MKDKIIHFLNKLYNEDSQKAISFHKLVKALNVTNSEIFKDLTELVNKNIVIKIENGKTGEYRLSHKYATPDPKPRPKPSPKPSPKDPKPTPHKKHKTPPPVTVHPENDIPVPNIEKIKKDTNLGTTLEKNWAQAVYKYFSTSHRGEKLTHNQWAAVIFNNGKAGIDSMSNVKQEYSIYFTLGKTYGFEEKKIEHDFPQWFKNTDHPQGEKGSPERLSWEIKHAIRGEINEIMYYSHKQIYSVKSNSISRIEDKSKTGNYIYTAELNLNEGEEPRMREGISFKLIGKIDYVCEVVEYDPLEAKLIFTNKLDILPSKNGSIKIQLDPSFILKNLQNNWTHYANNFNENTPLSKFINGKTNQLRSIAFTLDHNFNTYNLDESQQKAYLAAMSNDITFIWGPPGTGKSYTLARIIQSLYKQENERTLVCCVSNVAVDQLVNKVIDILPEHVEPGNFYRAGHTIDRRIVETDYLFPNNDQTNIIRDAISQYSDQLEKYKRILSEEKKAKIKSDIKDLREKLKEVTDSLVKSSKVVFSTISNFIVSTKLKEATFDNLIVDEASMLSMPYLVAIASRVSKRIILVGDFKQLSPISLTPNKHLRNSVFKLVGIDDNHLTHPALHQLLNQRRSYQGVVRLINDLFYSSKLKACVTKNELIEGDRYGTQSVVALNDTSGKVRFTKGGTRQNVFSAEMALKVLADYEKILPQDWTIGVITPYKGQVALIRAKMIEFGFGEEYTKRIKVGTIHTFQGSECEIIICDFVDTYRFEPGHQGSIGKIYGGADGEFLVNVAVSRAKYKLIAIGDFEYLSNPPGNVVSMKTMGLFKNIKCNNIN